MQTTNYRVIFRGDELYHHGIKGQKWYRRRFQNEDGSLTPAGRERYGVKEAHPHPLERFAYGSRDNARQQYQIKSNQTQWAIRAEAALRDYNSNNISGAGGAAADDIDKIDEMKKKLHSGEITDQQYKDWLYKYMRETKNYRDVVAYPDGTVTAKATVYEPKFIREQREKEQSSIKYKVNKLFNKTKKQVSGYVDKGKEFITGLFKK